MKKSIKRLVVGMTSLALLLTLTMIGKNIDAATGVGYATGTTVVVNERGGKATLDYVFSVDKDNGPVTSGYVILTWDDSLMQLESRSADNMAFDNEKPGEIHAQLLNGMDDENIGVTLNFKNVLPESSGQNQAVLNVKFKDAPGGLEFSGGDDIPLTLSQIQFTPAVVKYVEKEVSVSINPTSATVEKGKNQKFEAVVTNDSSGVDFGVDGTDSNIDANGLLSVGANESAKTLTVTATSKKDSTKVATAIVTVKEPAKPALSLSISPEKMQVLKGTASEVQYSATPSIVKDTTITYSMSGNKSKDTTISANGLVKVAANETADTLTISAKAENKSTDPETATAIATISLIDKLPVEIALDIANADVEQGGSQMFTALVLNDNGAGVTWELIGAKSKDTVLNPVSLLRATSNKAELKVGLDEAAGTKLTIKVTSIEDPTKTATAVVNVKAKAKVTTPAPTTPIAKPSTAPTSTGGVKTADTTNTGLLVCIMGLSLLVLSSITLRRKYSK